MTLEQRLVVIVEDDEAVRDSLSAVLSASNYPARCFSSAEQFLHAGIQQNVGCLIVDLRLPGMSGIELLSELDNAGVSVPAVVMTGQVDGETVQLLPAQESVSLLTKPCDPAQLLTLVAEKYSADDRRLGQGMARRGAADVPGR